MTIRPGNADPPRGEPDHRFTLANERTFLAWIRTSLALVAGGVAVTQVLPDRPGAARSALGATAIAFGVATSSYAYRHWRAVDQAIRSGRGLPPSRAPLLLAAGVGAVALAVLGLVVSG